jgi:23S rRNA (uracil1939-C5)-methyltransferase
VPIVCGGFSQASLLLNRVLRDCVRPAIGNPESVLDLYCGNGNFSLDLAGRARVLGLDHHAPSIAAAQATGAGEYAVGDEFAFVRAAARESWDVIVLDPPREGAKAIVSALAQSRTRRIVYVSCDPATLARDAKSLFSAGWALASLTAVDMFPHTAHIECVAAFDPRNTTY